MKYLKQSVGKTQKAFTISNDILEYIDKNRGFIPRSTFVDMILRSWMETDQELIREENVKIDIKEEKFNDIIICD